MRLTRLVVDFDTLDKYAEAPNFHDVLVSIRDADTVIALGAMHDRLRYPLGVWLEISEDYSAQMAARDVATLSWLAELDRVVVSSSNALAHAQVLEALLTNDEVNFTNEVATLVGAYNRPAPPSPVTVWSWDGTTLRHGEDVLHEVVSRSNAGSDYTLFM
jgi:hypothetical protein